ncbi:MAG: choice-of-anchor J domain-containing protein [Muribaculaceae bacterium]|nr:choice-of-anchor J domain-containing protein [Muribaculaceae bacterium]
MRQSPRLMSGTLPKAAGKGSDATIFGCMIGNDSWGYYDKPVGIYSIDTNTGLSAMTLATGLLNDGNPAGTYANGRFHASLTNDFYGTIYNITNVTIDMATGAISTFEMTDLVYENVSVNMTYDQINDIIYSINYGASTDEYNLCTFNPDTNSYTVIGALDDHYWGICVDGNGVMYGINDYGEAVTIDTATGAETGKVASTNYIPAMLQSCCWSPRDRRIYWAACNYAESQLIAIDPASGVSETLCTFPDGEEFIGLYCTDPVAGPKAPAACTALTVEYAAPGSNSATISCTLPDKTFDGSELSGSLTLTLKVDGNEIKQITGQTPGSTVSETTELTTGVHRVEAVCSNNEGKGVVSSVTTFAGTDTPGAPTGVAASQPDATTVELTWNAATTGGNGGWIDQAKVTYTVKRNGMEIASGLTSTGYTDHVDEIINAYNYVVETVYGGSACAASEEITVIGGSYIALPYSTDFMSADSFKLLTVIDGNNDGNTWKYDEDRASATYSYSRTLAADEYLVLPRVRMEKDHVYEVSFSGRSTSGSYPEKAEIVWGDSPAAESLKTVVMRGVTVPDDFSTYTGTHRASANGAGYFAIHCISDADMATFYVNEARIADLGHVNAPKAPTGLTATNSGGQTVEISMKMPAQTNSGASLSEISRLEIKRNGTLIHTRTNLAPNSIVTFSDNAPFGFNTYDAVAYAGDLAGVAARVKVFAGTYTLPFAVEPNADEFTQFTAETNPDSYDNEWYFDISNNALKISTYGSEDTDQFVFTPEIELGTAHQIDLSFDVCAGLQYDTESVEITYGREPVRSAHTAIATIDFNNTEFATRTVTFEIPEPGRYYIGFHAISGARHTCLSVKNIRLENGALKLAPAEPAGVTSKAGERGALTASVEFTVPDRNLYGESLDGSGVDVALTRADGSLAASLTGAAPGSRHTLTDNNASAGINTYTLTCSNSYGRGGTAQTNVWCGVDIPAHIENLDVLPTADNMGAVLSWSAPEGSVHNGWIDPENLTYRIYQLYNGRDLVKVAETGEETCTVYPDGGVLDFYTFYVSASTEAGEGIMSYTGIVVGTPATLPMRETASNRIITCMPWISGALEGDVNWGVADYIASVDVAADDGGMFVCSSQLPYRAPGAARMQLPKLAFKGLNAPTLTFKMYHYAAPGAGLNVSITTDDVNFTPVISVMTNGEAEGWKTYSVNLAAFKDAPWVAIVFDGVLENGSSYVIVDDIEVANESEYDLALATIRGKSIVEVGERSAYLVEVKNCGKQHAAFELNMKANGMTIGSVKRESQLPAESSDIYSFEFTATADHLGAPVVMSLEIIPDGFTDEIPENNKGEFEVTVVQPEMPVVTDLAISAADNGAVLEWSAPSLVPAQITDSFEDYESFSYEEIGDYVLIDGDGLTPCGILGVNHPNMGRPMAFQVWEPMAEGVDVDSDLWAPKSGKKCLVAWTSLSSVEEPYNDDWLISPALHVSESPQTIKFHASRPVGDFGPENFEVLYSLTGTDVDEFILLKRETVAIGGWKEYIYELPAGATRFAIRYTSRNKFALLFDDLTYTPASETDNLTINGFNVFRSGSKIGSTAAGATTFTDGTPDENAPYNVTVVYDRGESHMSNTVSLSASGVALPAIFGGVVVRGGIGVIAVEHASGMPVTVTAANGMIVANSATHGDRAEFAVAPGVYAVTVASHTVKVAVK